MFIRCNELNIPAVIGVGKQVYEEILQCKLLELDCKSKKLRVLKYEYWNNS